jgi:hypothetical protein
MFIILLLITMLPRASVKLSHPVCLLKLDFERRLTVVEHWSHGIEPNLDAAAGT